MLSVLCLFLAAAPNAAASTPAMRNALESMATVTPWLASPDPFRDPKHRADIARSLDTLAQLKHGFFRGPTSSTAGLAELFGNQAAWARADFLAGNTESARYRVRGLTQLCMSCHLREPSRDFIDALKVVDRVPLPPLEHAAFLATTRQFDRALDVWRTALVRPTKLEPEMFEQLDGLRLALRVAVRLRDDVNLTHRLIVPQLLRVELPGIAVRELEGWERDAVAWEHEHFLLAEQPPEQLLLRARMLVEGSGAENTVAPMPEHFIALLRAASYLDEVLRRDPEGPWRSEALYLLGVVHPSVSDSPVWQLEWMYLEACIRENAGTSRGRICGQRLKDRTWFTWHSEADMPAATVAALGELLALANAPSR